MMMTAIQRKRDSDQSLVLPQSILLVLSLVSISFDLITVTDTWVSSNSDTFFSCCLERSYKKSKKHKKKSKKRRHKSVKKLLIFILHLDFCP